MSFLLDLEEAYDELWPVVQNTDGINRISIDLNWGDDTVTISIWPEGHRGFGFRPISATVKWTAKTSTLINKLRTELRALTKQHFKEAENAAHRVKQAAEEVKVAETYSKNVQEKHRRLRMLAPSPLEELAQQAEE